MLDVYVIYQSCSILYYNCFSVGFFFFFFKQKTAYEMRISDWSSDVCSSDLFDLFHKSTKIRRAQALIVHDDHRTILEVSHERSKRSFAIFRDIWGNHDETPDTIMFMLNFTHHVRQFLRQIAPTMRGEGAFGTS